MTKNISTNKFISTPIILDEIFFQIYINLEDSVEKCNEFLSSLNKKYILKSNVNEIPYYNSNRSKPYNNTLHIMVKLDDYNYNRLLGKKDFIDDQVKIDIINFMKKQSTN